MQNRAMGEYIAAQLDHRHAVKEVGLRSNTTATPGGADGSATAL
jgi:hypothetical protein